jgi:hypothetical protein
MKKLLLIMILMATILVACTPEYTPPENAIIHRRVTDSFNIKLLMKGGMLAISRFVDEEAGAVCWLYEGYEKGGISCLPLDQTNLGK